MKMIQENIKKERVTGLFTQFYQDDYRGYCQSSFL